jgi:hypothetical protein
MMWWEGGGVVYRGDLGEMIQMGIWGWMFDVLKGKFDAMLWNVGHFAYGMLVVVDGIEISEQARASASSDGVAMLYHFFSLQMLDYF